ncbi:MAG: tetratricopeptide repeat protein [Gammaproteobacteria bacterium]
MAALRGQAREAWEAGDFDRAEQLLNEASAKDLAAAERQESMAKQRRFSAAQSKANNGDLKGTQFAYREAAEYYRQAAALVPAEAETQRAEYLNLQGRVLHEAGDYRHAEPCSIKPKAGTPRPSRSISGRWLSLRRPSGRYILPWRYSERTTPHRCGRGAGPPRPTPSRRGLPRQSRSRIELGGVTGCNPHGLLAFVIPIASEVLDIPGEPVGRG